MALYEVVLQQVYDGQECINRWNYVGSGTPAAVSPSFALLSAMGFIAGESDVFPTGTLFAQLRNLQGETLVYNEVIALNVYDPSDFYTTGFPSGTAGNDSTGGGAAPILAAGFRTNLVRRDIARGTKRFAGVVNGNIGAHGVLNTGYVAIMEAFTPYMDAVLTYDDEGNTLSFSPCVVKKLKYTTPSGKKAYKYYPTYTEQIALVAQGIHWETYNQIRSQTSRQVGKGS